MGHFGQGSGIIWLDDLWCGGFEEALSQCSHNEWGVHNCGHSEDVGIFCSTTTTTTTTTTATTTTTTTTTPCNAGFFFIGGVCSPCDAGTHADAGSFSCLPVLSYVLSAVQTPEITMANDGFGVVRMAAVVSHLPAAIYGGGTLRYMVDMTSSEQDSLDHTGSCSAYWIASPTQLTAVLLYEVLAGPCNLSVNVSEDSIVLEGFLHVLLLHTSSGETSTVAQWRKPVALTFARSVLAARDTYVAAVMVAGGQSEFYVSDFSSALAAYASHTFEVVVNPMVTTYMEGELVFLRHSLQPEVEGLSLVPDFVWLSASSDPEEPATQMLDINDLGLTSGAGCFSVRVTACRQCFLHVASKVVVDGAEERRLVQSTHALVDLFMDVRSAEDAAPPLVVPPWVAIGISFVTSVALGAAMRLLQTRCSAYDCGPLEFLGVEVADALFDVIVYLFAAGAGDLKFANDEFRLVELAIIASTVVSVFLFLCEVVIFRVLQAQFCALIPHLVCIHLVSEDFFQLCLYSFVAASHANEGLKTPVGIAAMIQCGVFVFTKLRDAFCRNWSRVDATASKEASYGPEADREA